MLTNEEIEDKIHSLIGAIWENQTCPDDKYYDTEELEDDFLIFYLYAYAHLGLPRPSFAQMYMAYFIANDPSKYRMLMALRGLAKSLTAQIYTVWRLFRDANEHILVMSVSATRAKNFTGFCKKIIKLLPVTQNMSPRHREERTSDSAFDVAGAEPSDSASLYAVGVGNPIAGFRATLIIYDDIESAQSAVSVVLTETIDNNATEAQNLLIAGCDEVITLCTPHSMSSVYNQWLERGHKALILPAQYPSEISIYGGRLAPYIVDRLKRNPSLIGTNVDERYNLELLEARRLKIGNSKYRLQYLLDVSESDDLKHPLKLSDLIVTDIGEDEIADSIQYSSMPDNTLHMKHHGFKTDRLYMPRYISPETSPYERRIMVIDPSGTGSDETAFAILFSSKGRIIANKIGGITGGYSDEVIVQLINLAHASRVDTIVLESNFGDGIFTKLLESASTKMLKPKDRPFFEHIRNTKQKEARIIDTLEPILNQHRLIVAKSVLDQDLRADIIYSFTYQLSHIRREKGCLRHDDRLDCLELGCRFLSDVMSYIEPEDEDLDKLWEDLQGMNRNRATIKKNYGSTY